MNSGKFRLFLIGLVAIATIACGLMAVPAHAAFFQKRFMVCKDRGRDVLCDPYIVQKNDYVIKLFKQRGEIAYEDFPKFLGIFSRINPDIKDIDKIYPNQRILIPLKLLAPGSLEGQSTGTVTIPIITITNLPDSMLQNSSLYEVESGDTVSKLILNKFGKLNPHEYEKVLELFKYMNPDLDDINLIRVGEKIRLPDPAIRNAAWYDAVFDASGQIASEEPFEAPEPEPSPPEPEPAAAPALKPEPEPEPAPESEPAKVLTKAVEKPKSEPQAPKKEPSPPVPKPPQLLPLYKNAARVLNVQFMGEGDFFFPRPGQADYKIELAQTPVMELPGGRRLIFDHQGIIGETAMAAIRKFWRDIRIVRLNPNFNMRDLFKKICPIIDPEGCQNKLDFTDNGVSVTVRGEYIYDRLDGDGKVCLTFISHENEQTAPAIRRYLAHQWIQVEDWINRENFFVPARQSIKDKAGADSATTIRAASPSDLVRQLAAQLGYNYQENVEISFPYAGFQVSAWTNMLSLGPANEVLIDFGDLQGDAVASIEATGFRVIQIRSKADYYRMAREFLSALPVEQVNAPVLWAAERRRIHNTSIGVPGTVVSVGDQSGAGSKILITGVELPPEIRYFISRKGLQILQIIGQ